MGSHVEFRLFAIKVTNSKYYFILQPSGISNINNNMARAWLSSSKL
jgi:hypothetical protein